MGHTLTTIAYDGHYLCADSQLTGSYKMAHSKVYLLPDGTIAACAGLVRDGQKFIRWLLDGADVDDWPSMEDFGAIVAFPGGIVKLYEDGPMVLDITGKKHAIGSGGDFAMGAMACDKTAERAVEIASQLDPHTGFTVETFDTTKIEKGRRRRRRKTSNYDSP